MPRSSGTAAGARHPVWLVCGLTAVCTAFNLTKAVHMDDTAYLEIARAIAEHPAHYMGDELNWDDTAEPLHRLNQPHLLFYPMAWLIRSVGPSELALHAGMAGAAAFAIAAFHALARSLAPEHAALLTVLFALGPSFLPAQNLMVDVPLVGLWLCFFWGLLGGPHRSRVAACAVSALAAAAACLVKYVSLVLLPVFAAALALRRDWRCAALLGVPLAALAGWSLLNYLDYGGVHLAARAVPPRGLSDLGVAAVEWLTALGAVAPFSALWLAELRTRRELRGCLAAAAAAGLLVFQAAGHHPDASLPVRALWALFLGNGVFLAGATACELAREVRSSARAGDRQRLERVVVLSLWLLGAFCFVAWLAPFMAVRHVLLAVPAVLLVLAGGTGRALGSRAARPALAATAGLGLLLAWSDLRYAAVHREYAPRIARNLEGARVWQLGHWGWQWYANRAGMQTYDSLWTQLAPGDYLVIAGTTHTQELRPEHRSILSEVGRIEVSSAAPDWLRTVSRSPAGGYHGFSFATRSLPWIFSAAPLEIYTILVAVEPDR